MFEANTENGISRRAVLAGGAVAIASTLVARKTEAQPEEDNNLPRTKKVREYVSESELVEWTQQFQTLINNGTSIVRSFEILAANTTNEFLRAFSQDALEILGRGYILSDLMEMNRHIFNRDYVTTVRYGEIYGELDTVLEKWLKHRPKRD